MAFTVPHVPSSLVPEAQPLLADHGGVAVLEREHALMQHRIPRRSLHILLLREWGAGFRAEGAGLGFQGVGCRFEG